MNWIKANIFITLVAQLVMSCDSFQEDVAPKGEDELVLKHAITALPNTSLLIDLKKTIHSSSVVKFSLNKIPQKGTAEISDQAILEYTPHNDFLSGSDFFSLDLLDVSGTVVDTDTLFITMGNSADSLPCFNGAMSDYYSTSMDTEVIISPLQNDGLCADSIAKVEFNLLSDPTNGILTQVGSIAVFPPVYGFSYAPNPEFSGTDVFAYELILTDLAEEEYSSMAKVYIDVHKDSLSLCYSMIQPITYYIYEDTSAFHIIDLFWLDPFACGGYTNNHELEILSVYSGQAEVFDDNSIRYYPGEDSIDFVEYQVVFPDQFSVSSTATIIYDHKTDPADSTNCLEAFDDNYNLYIIPDSIGSPNEPYIMNLTANDVLCNLNDYQVTLLSDPKVGVATINAEQNLEYYAQEEFAGVMNFSMLYELCSEAVCDSAVVYLSVENL